MVIWLQSISHCKLLSKSFQVHIYCGYLLEHNVKIWLLAYNFFRNLANLGLFSQFKKNPLLILLGLFFFFVFRKMTKIRHQKKKKKKKKRKLAHLISKQTSQPATQPVFQSPQNTPNGLEFWRTIWRLHQFGGAD